LMELCFGFNHSPLFLLSALGYCCGLELNFKDESSSFFIRICSKNY
jgi:hypothetical protein